MAAQEQHVGAVPAAGIVLETQQWVQCEKCSKWRRIPAAVAESLDDDAAWYCEHNRDEAHNSCDIPQELTDAEIDLLHTEHDMAGAGGGAAADLVAGGDAPDGTPRRLYKRPPVWQLITSNLYTHRERKEQDEDDIMICQCKKIWATDSSTVGCGPECLNRMLNIECVEEYCPSGHRCSNQMFTKKEYSKLEVKRAGTKGFGLFAGRDMKAGQFLIEYLGEVLEEEEYHRRKEYFIEMGQRHYYFMNVGNGEVIDASRRGNLGRFINHSCEPNCETQKWVVHGELAIGLFTLKDIPAGTELTFDYNFERYGDKPMKCLCGSKNCRGIIGGTQDKEGSAATRAAIEAAVEVPDEELDPDYIMVTEKEQDAALSAILDRVVGLGWETGWTPKLSDRLQKLAYKHGVDLTNMSDDEDEGMVAGASSGLSEEEEEMAAAAAAVVASKRGQQRKPAGKAKARKPAKQRKPVADESDWEAELSAASSGSDLEASDSEAGSVDGSREEAAAARAAARAARQSNVQAAARAAASLVVSELPLRRRLKKFARVAMAAEAAVTTPAGSTGSQPQQQQQQRRLGSSAGSRAAQSVASSVPGSAVPLIPKRSTALATPFDRPGLSKRCSEIDRRLDELVNASGRLREAHPDIIIRVLRLFNLCEIGPTVGKMESDTDSQQQRPDSGGGAAPQRSDGSGPHSSLLQNGSASDLRVPRPLSHNESGSTAAPAALCEEGEVSPERSAPEPPPPPPQLQLPAQPPAAEWERVQHDGLQPPRQRASPGKDRRAEVSSRIRAAWAEAQRSGQLSAQQSARIADMSLLLDVVLKTNTLSAKKDFVKCGILRQLLGVVGGNTGKQYGIILKKVMRVVESLPLTPDDMHHTRSAHGSFADLLRELAQSADFEIRSKAYGLLKKFPVQGCTRPMLPDAMHSSAGSSRSRPPSGLLMSPSGGGPGLAPPPGAWRDGPPSLPLVLAPPGCVPYGGSRDGPPLPGHFWEGPQLMVPPPLDGFRPREPMPPSRFGPGRGPPAGHGGRPGLPLPMGRPISLLPPHMHHPPPHHYPPPHVQHGGPPAWQPPPLLPPPGGAGTPVAAPNGATPWPVENGGPPSAPASAAGSSRKRSRWDQPSGVKDDSANPGSPPDARTPRGMMPPGFCGGGDGDGGEQEGEPSSKRAANGVHCDGSPALAELAAAASWDVETQFAVGTLGGTSSYLATASGANLSPDTGPSCGAGLSYSPVAAHGGGLSPGQQPSATRPSSAAYSHAASGGSAGADAMGSGDMHMSPMSDDDVLHGAAAAAPGPPSLEPPPLPQHDYEQQEGEEGEETWDSPDASFASYVAEMVRRRVGKYAQPDHPMCIAQDEAAQLYSKIRREIVAKEQQAYVGRQTAGVFKPIERGKLEAKIREFVRDSIRRYHDRRGGY